MKWYSDNGEFAFFSFGGTANGIIAIGGVAHGVVAIGGIVSVGVISIGMNAVGSLVACGLNAVGPVSLSLINGVGIYARAGVNGWGVIASARTNAYGLTGGGGVTSEHSIVPALIVIMLLVVGSSIFPGSRASRTVPKDLYLPLAKFLASPELSDEEVRARVAAVDEQRQLLELTDGASTVQVQPDDSTMKRALELTDLNPNPFVLAKLVRIEERVPVSQAETGYRERAPVRTTESFRCLGIEPGPEPDTWLPKDRQEVQWVIAWSARLAVLGTLAVLLWIF